jgi:hypothetical protein
LSGSPGDALNTGRPELAGEDFAQLAADGRIRLLVSFDGAAQPCPSPMEPARAAVRQMGTT